MFRPASNLFLLYTSGSHGRAPFWIPLGSDLLQLNFKTFFWRISHLLGDFQPHSVDRCFFCKFWIRLYFYFYFLSWKIVSCWCFDLHDFKIWVRWVCFHNFIDHLYSSCELSVLITCVFSFELFYFLSFICMSVILQNKAISHFIICSAITFSQSVFVFCQTEV